MSADVNNIHLTDERFAELSRAAQAQGKTPDDLADEAIAILLRKRRRSGRVPGRCVHSPDSTTSGPIRYGLHACFYGPSTRRKRRHPRWRQKCRRLPTNGPHSNPITHLSSAL